ncbi:MAG TPA: class I SAM-dependent methyltransferase [Bdellovibrionales bacterium]|nr:MAG: hypothetical protein A2X97_08610 [Bdellovibrionales bacterium GWA1_52_35]HAR43441.1 class I SAM-dependent methyltransferase [Bdellovibrionales bacterium]HCM41643.1 class I SAM-dependent methyltransferase [Bdellovibrionales bacterium]
MKINSRKNFGVSDTIHNATYYDALNTFTHDIPFYLNEAKKARGPVLELCCGTGRISIPLAEAGVNITGVDITKSMLTAAKSKAAKANLATPFHLADIKSVRLRKKYQLVFIPFNSLQCIYTLSDIEKVFATVKFHLAPGGKFIFDVFNPSIDYMVKMKKRQNGKYRLTLADRRKVSIDEICSYDSEGQVNRVTWFHRTGKSNAIPEQLDMRCFYPLEMAALLKYNGFRVLKKYGSFSKSPFTSDSMKQIFICEAGR